MLRSLPRAAAIRHVALIMDGNRRWASAHGLPIVEGYRRGIAALRASVRAAIGLGVPTLTVYGFSTENWQRDAREVNMLMQLCAVFARNDLVSLERQGVRVTVLGDVEAFAAAARVALADLVRGTASNSRLTLNLALNYSGRSEIVRAARSVADDVARGTLAPQDVNEAAFRARLYAPEQCDPDLLVRTGGDRRISNFLLYQLAYTELLTLDVLWPDFTERHFEAAVAALETRQRRFGS